MPWNLQRTKYATGGSAIVNPCLLSDLAPNVSNMAKVSNSYDNTKTVEGQLEPPGWIAGRYFTVGFTIMDSNGNFQTCSAAGVSGATAPTWATGGYTFDGAATWSCVKAIQPAVSITPAQHRIPDMPRFPVYWYSETIARLMPPTSTSGLTIWGAWNQWQPNSNGTSTPDPGWHKETSADTKGMAYGWWIYSVSINRCMNPVKVRGPVSAAEFGAGDTGSPGAGDAGQSGAGAGGPGTGPNAGPVEDTSEIACTIGCMRTIGGVNTFVAFQTFQTGATYQVLWPVFTSDALVYQCAERLDIQAVAIASGGSVSVGATISEPSLVAAFVSDTIALLNLIV